MWTDGVTMSKKSVPVEPLTDQEASEVRSRFAGKPRRGRRLRRERNVVISANTTPEVKTMIGQLADALDCTLTEAIEHCVRKVHAEMKPSSRARMQPSEERPPETVTV